MVPHDGQSRFKGFASTMAKRAKMGEGQAMVALLRGVNVGGNKRVPMKELSAVAEALGYEKVSTYLQSGNLLLTSWDPAPDVELALEKAIATTFGFSVDVVVRTAKQWRSLASSNPFGDAAATRPNLLHLALSKATPKPDAAVTLEGKASPAERVKLLGGGLWIDYGAGVGRSKLSPAVLDRAVGSSVTARNFNTVTELGRLLTHPSTD